MLRRQHMRITWEPARMSNRGTDLGIKFAAEARACTPGSGGVTRTGTLFRVWPTMKDGSNVQAATREQKNRAKDKKERDIVMTTDKVTGWQTVILRGADAMAGRKASDPMSAHGGGAGEAEQEPRRANPIAGGQEKDALGLGQAGGTGVNIFTSSQSN